MKEKDCLLHIPLQTGEEIIPQLPAIQHVVCSEVISCCLVAETAKPQKIKVVLSIALKESESPSLSWYLKEKRLSLGRAMNL